MSYLLMEKIDFQPPQIWIELYCP